MLNNQCYWSEYITIMLWPFGLVISTYGINNLHVDMNVKTPEMNLSVTIGSTTWISNFHKFGYPVYILDDFLQSVGGVGPPK